jgi:tRNA threonylcarbamoyladenosine biosynthesis protein TsaE
MAAHHIMMMLREIRCTSEEATIAVGRAIAAVVQAGDLIALEGPLGAGKTVLVRGLAEGLGVDPREVCSPTFVLCHEYDGAVPLVHIDAYRLQGSDELATVGFDEMVSAGDRVIVVEWADRVADALPAARLHITLRHVEDDAGHHTRDLTVRGSHEQVEALSRHVAAGRCPICDRAMVGPGAPPPFCSSRCRDADLGRWLGGSYRISRPAGMMDLEEG